MARWYRKETLSATAPDPPMVKDTLKHNELCVVSLSGK
jgi:hypothetical protein